MRLSLISLSVSVTLVACIAGAGDSARSGLAVGATCSVKGRAKAIACDELYHPVCGCDGKTYATPCAAHVRVASWLEGECTSSEPACVLSETRHKSCPDIDKPVCGCDGTTYRSACEAGSYITSWIEGKCTAGTECTAHTSEARECAEFDKPVCGCDGQTYRNPCKAGRAVASWVDGECFLPEDTTPGAGRPHGPAPEAACLVSFPDPPVCVKADEPVCGCDGLTYENACEARAYVTAWVEGACTDASSAPSSP